MTNVSMAMLARELSSQVGRIVIDESGVKGNYDFKLEFAPERNDPMKPLVGPDKPEPAPERPSLFTALQEQLGLRLEAKKGPVQFLVIDQAAKATEN